MELIEITSQEWSDWKSSKVTKALVQRLYQKREGLKESVVEEQVPAEVREKYVGQCQAYKDTMNYIVEEFEVIGLEESE